MLIWLCVLLKNNCFALYKNDKAVVEFGKKQNNIHIQNGNNLKFRKKTK